LLAQIYGLAEELLVSAETDLLVLTLAPVELLWLELLPLLVPV
jgi:hypothetical protein